MGDCLHCTGTRGGSSDRESCTMSGQAQTPEASADDGYSDDGFEFEEPPAASPDPTALSIVDFLKGSQERAPTSPRTLEACAVQGVNPDDLVKVGYEMITGGSDQERKLRFRTREKRRKVYVKEVHTKYRELMTQRPQSLPQLDSVRSQIETNRKNRVDSVLQREQRDLARKKKSVEMQLEQSLNQLKQADKLEKQWNNKLQKIDKGVRATQENRETEAVCRAVWRRNKKEKAHQQAVTQLERRAQRVMSKEHGRVHALQKKEQKTQQMIDRLRVKSNQKLDQAAQTAADYDAEQVRLEVERLAREGERSKAYDDSVKRHKIEAELRGKQRDIVVDIKRDKVRAMEVAMAEATRQTVIEKQQAFERRKEVMDEQQGQALEKRKEWEEKCKRRQDEVLQRAEERQEELHKQMVEIEQSSTRALAKRDEQQAMKQLKQELKMEKMLRKVNLDNEKDTIMQTEKRREAELLKQLKRQSALMQKQLKDTAVRKYQKMRFRTNASTPPKLSKPVGSPLSSPYSQDGFEASSPAGSPDANVQLTSSASAKMEHFDF